MVNTYQIILLLLILTACKQKTEPQTISETENIFNQELLDELNEMAKTDQIAAYIPQGKHKKLTKTEWKQFKDSVFTTHEKRLQELFNEHGFIGFDIAGKEGSKNFWLMVQHSDHNPTFQKKVLKQMKIEVEAKNADPVTYGLLTDRVQLNTGEAQIYGTQVTYNMNTGQAYPKKLMDSTNVNKRRASLGMESIESYLNSMTEMHYEMNKDNYLKIGITEPQLYKLE